MPYNLRKRRAKSDENPKTQKYARVESDNSEDNSLYDSDYSNTETAESLSLDVSFDTLLTSDDSENDTSGGSENDISGGSENDTSGDEAKNNTTTNSIQIFSCGINNNKNKKSYTRSPGIRKNKNNVNSNNRTRCRNNVNIKYNSMNCDNNVNKKKLNRAGSNGDVNSNVNNNNKTITRTNSKGKLNNNNKTITRTNSKGKLNVSKSNPKGAIIKNNKKPNKSQSKAKIATAKTPSKSAADKSNACMDNDNIIDDLEIRKKVIETHMTSGSVSEDTTMNDESDLLANILARHMLEKFNLDDVDEDYRDYNTDYDANYEFDYDPNFSKLSKRQQNKIKAEYKKLQKEIDSERPTIRMIMNLSMSRENKKLCLEKFKAMQQCEIDSYEYNQVKKELLDFINDNTLRDSTLEDEDKRLRALYTEQVGLRESILRLDAPDHTKATIYTRYNSLLEMNKSDSEYTKAKQWIEWAISLPHNHADNKIVQLIHASKEERGEVLSDVMQKLNSHLYGMDKVKHTVICILNNFINSGVTSGTAFGMVGEPGTGKTKIAQTLAEVLELPFDKIDLGGVTDPATLMGHDETYISAGPGLIVKILKRMKYSNGIVLFDEIDKLGTSKHGRDVQYALLHITDFTTNQEFRDTYLSELKIDLSNIWFIYTMNDVSYMDSALRDRLPIIEVPKYDTVDKINIITTHLLPNVCKQLNVRGLTISRDAAEYIVKKVPTTGGVRKIKDKIQYIIERISLYQSLPANSALVWFQMPEDFNGEITVDVIRAVNEEEGDDNDDLARRMMYL